MMLMPENEMLGVGDILFDGEHQGDPPPEQEVREDYGGTSTVSAINKCFSHRARKLYIYDIGFKLRHPDVYDIGGTYSEEQPNEIISETWFFFSTTVCPANNYLLNLFVCHRKAGNISIAVSNANELSHNKKREKGGQSWLPDTLEWHMFRTAQPDENYHIKTFCFSESDVKALEFSTLVMPIDIQTKVLATVNNEIVKRIKLNHDFGDVLSKQDKADFVLTSATQKQYPVHKIFLAAHSAVLRDLIKNIIISSKDAHAFIDINDSDMELLLEFIYTGTIKDILNKDCIKLLHIADRFKLENLFFLTQFALADQINIENAVDIACIAENYNLEKLQTIVFNFIKNNPKVLETEGWRNLDDVNLAKKLFQFMHTKRD